MGTPAPDVDISAADRSDLDVLTEISRYENLKEPQGRFFFKDWPAAPTQTPFYRSQLVPKFDDVNVEVVKVSEGEEIVAFACFTRSDGRAEAGLFSGPPEPSPSIDLEFGMKVLKKVMGMRKIWEGIPHFCELSPGPRPGSTCA